MQCHSPIAFVTGERDVSGVMEEGVSCTFCHSYVGLSQTVNADDNILANAEYKLNPGQGIMYGSIKNPIGNYYHESQYNPIFSRSNICLPCHDFTIRGMEAEITFTEWYNATAGGMVENKSCQSCHMPLENGRHRHDFVGVDLDLTKSIYDDDSQYSQVSDLLKKSVTLKFLYDSDEINFLSDDTFNIPISVTNLVEHDIPSGTSFSRESWLEINVYQNEDTLFSSGNIKDSSIDLNLDDESLLFFTSFILDSNSDTLYSITNAVTYHPMLLPALSTVKWEYNFIDSNGDLDKDVPVSIAIRMLFRSFKPIILRYDHPELLDNLPIFEMARLDTVINLN